MDNNQKIKFVAKTLFGLEPLLCKELEALGAVNIEPINRAVLFEGDLEVLYKANYCTYTALRILQPFAEFEINSTEELYEAIKNIEWEKHFHYIDTILIDPIVNSEIFTHSKYVAQLSKDAIADRFVERYGKRPSVDVENPTFLINVHIYKNKCTVSFDTTGESLHKRGYRTATGVAPINEVLAAGLVLLSGYDGSTPFYDPMCGSGTILCEAGLIASNTPPGIFRKHFNFMNFKNFDRKLYMKIKNEANRNRREIKERMYGFDISRSTLEVATQNFINAKLDEYITIKEKDFIDSTPLTASGIMIFNPPYGERMHKYNVEEFYGKIGSTLKRNYTNFTVFMVSSNDDAIHEIGLRAAKRTLLYNGKLEVKYLEYHLYEGTKKTKLNQGD